MAFKILLADKSITIQKVVEMLFSGKDYEVLCVSDGETALAEASRVIPDVILADVDLPRIDGYTFSARLKQVPALAQTPIILMMSRDDVFDGAKARQVSIVDHIAKPFESQDLISKVKKAVSSAKPRPAEMPSAAQRPAAPSAPKPPSRPAPPKDIFDIIQDAPAQTDLPRSRVKPEHDEGVYEVEPVVEIEEPLGREAPSGALPVGQKAVDEMRESLGLDGKSMSKVPDIANFELPDAGEYAPPRQQMPRRPAAADMREAREYIPPSAETVAPSAGGKNAPAGQQLQVSEDLVRQAIEQSVSKIVREVAREVIEKVAWEVVPDLAAAMIREEIERLKSEQ